MTEIIIYTAGGIVSYVLRDTTKDYKRDLTAALENGTTTVETIDGSSLIINPLNAAAIEIRDHKQEEDPPGVPV